MLFTRVPRVRVTQALVGLNAVVFLAMVATGVSLMQPSTDSLLRWGADYGPRTTAGEWWRLLSNTFLHVGLIHIAMNMVGLWQIGAVVERLLGHRAFLLVYLVSGVCGSLASHHLASLCGVGGRFRRGFWRLRRSGGLPGTAPRVDSAAGAAGVAEEHGHLHRLERAAGMAGEGHRHGRPPGWVAGRVRGGAGGFATPAGTSRAASTGQLVARSVVVAAVLVLVGAAVLLLPRALDVQSELREFQRIEQTAIDAYNGGIERHGAGKLSDEGLADLVDRQVLPPWRAYQAHLRTLRALPPQQARWIDDLTQYLESARPGLGRPSATPHEPAIRPRHRRPSGWNSR